MRLRFVTYIQNKQTIINLINIKNIKIVILILLKLVKYIYFGNKTKTYIIQVHANILIFDKIIVNSIVFVNK